MIATIILNNKTVRVDLGSPLDISIPLRAGTENVNAFYIPPVKIEPFQAGSFIGAVNRGGSCNVNNILFNPHGNGTHTECVGHISRETYTINQCLKEFFFVAELITVVPESKGDDKVITQGLLEAALKSVKPDALILRTSPNEDDKINRQYSGTNPAYMDEEAAHYLASIGTRHLLLDVPSIDKEDDGGKLLAHHAFWRYPENIRVDSTITELMFVPDSIPDGSYLLNIQIASFENDASPSKPLLYRLTQVQ